MKRSGKKKGGGDLCFHRTMEVIVHVYPSERARRCCFGDRKAQEGIAGELSIRDSL